MSPPPAHSKLGASSYKRWKACPGSVRLSEGIEQPPSHYAIEGTLAHEYASHILTTPIHSKDYNVDGLVHEMRDAIAVYINHVFKLRRETPLIESVEQRFDLSSYHPALFGTADYVCYYPVKKELHVVDYKHGKGVAVEVAEKGIPNEQLMYYGLGALHQNRFPIDKIVLTIVQPRKKHKNGPIRSVEVMPIEMIDYAATLVEDAIKTEDPNAPLITGKHCFWCPASFTCPEKNKEFLKHASDVFGIVEG